MKRFFGMMPSDEIAIEKEYKTDDSYKITIQAGPNGWSVLYPDGSSYWGDAENTTEENFKTAYDSATTQFGVLTEEAPNKKCYNCYRKSED